MEALIYSAVYAHLVIGASVSALGANLTALGADDCFLAAGSTVWAMETIRSGTFTTHFAVVAPSVCALTAYLQAALASHRIFAGSTARAMVASFQATFIT